MARRSSKVANSDHRQRIVSAFNRVDAKNLDFLDEFYAAEIEFHDPLRSALGLTEVKRYYRHAFKHVRNIRFDFGSIGRDGDEYFAPWTMTLEVQGLNSGNEYSLAGFSHLKFNRDGLVTYHRDYFDVGALVYERLPLQRHLISMYRKILAGRLSLSAWAPT